MFKILGGWRNPPVDERVFGIQNVLLVLSVLVIALVFALNAGYRQALILVGRVVLLAASLLNILVTLFIGDVV